MYYIKFVYENIKNGEMHRQQTDFDLIHSYLYVMFSLYVYRNDAFWKISGEMYKAEGRGHIAQKCDNAEC